MSKTLIRELTMRGGKDGISILHNGKVVIKDAAQKDLDRLITEYLKANDGYPPKRPYNIPRTTKLIKEELDKNDITYKKRTKKAELEAILRGVLK
jgi:hypothetical protein